MIVSGVVRSRLRIGRNALLRGPAGRAGRVWLGGAILLGLSALATAALVALFSRLAAAGAPPEEAGALLAWILTAALAGLVVFDLHDAVATLLLASDLELLRAAPVRSRSLLALKLADALPRTTALLVALVIPAALAFGVAYPLPGWTWAILPALLAALWAIPLGAGTALALHLVRGVPARSAREALGLLSTLIIVGLWLANSFVLPRLGERTEPLVSRLGATLRVPPLVAMLSPAHWAATVLVACASRDPMHAAGAAGALLLGAALAVLWAARTASDHLETALANLARGGARRRIGPRARTRGHASQAAAILVRDARLFRRDWTVWSDVLAAAALWTLLPLVGAPLIDASPALLARGMLVALAVGLGVEVAARSSPLEREGLAWARVAPVAARKWIAAKLLGVAAVSLPLLAVTAAILRFALPLSTAQWGEAVAVGLGALGLSLGLGLWVGLEYGDPEWTNPRAMIRFGGRLLAALLLIVQAGLWLGLMALADRWRTALPGAVLVAGPLALSALLASIPIRAATSRIGRVEWSRRAP